MNGSPTSATPLIPGPGCSTAQGRIINLLNNYAWISFNFGPTLLQWMAEAAPEALRGLVEADRLSQDRRGGHGNALAQVYNHMIMPLASLRTSRPRCSGGFPIFATGSAVIPKECGWPRPPWTSEPWKPWPKRASRSRSWPPRQAKRWRKIGRK